MFIISIKNFPNTKARLGWKSKEDLAADYLHLFSIAGIGFAATRLKWSSCKKDVSYSHFIESQLKLTFSLLTGAREAQIKFSYLRTRYPKISTFAFLHPRPPATTAGTMWWRVYSFLWMCDKHKKFTQSEQPRTSGKPSASVEVSCLGLGRHSCPCPELQKLEMPEKFKTRHEIWQLVSIAPMALLATADFKHISDIEPLIFNQTWLTFYIFHWYYSGLFG